MSSASSRKKDTPHIIVQAPLRVPHSVKVTELYESQPNTATNGGISRAQFKRTAHDISAGSPIPLSSSRTTDNFRMHQVAEIGKSVPSADPPVGWDESVISFLSRFCSLHQFSLESLSTWHDEIAKLKLPDVQPRDLWDHTEPYIRYIGWNLKNNNPLTGNLSWAMVHFLVQMRCLKTMDFLGDVDPILRGLTFVLRIALKGLSLNMESQRLRRALADRAIASGAKDLIIDKYKALDNGEVRSHAFKQVLADPRMLCQQVLHYTLVATANLDIKNSHSAYILYLELVGMLTDLFVSQVYAQSIDKSVTVFVEEFLTNIGPSTAYNIERTPAQELVDALLANASEPPIPPTKNSIVSSAYSYFFASHTAAQAKSIEQQSLLLLLLFVVQNIDQGTNPFLEAFENAADTPEGMVNIDRRLSFRKLFDKIVKEIDRLEWSIILQLLVSRNESFRVYLLARTDPDTIIIPLLKTINISTALPLPSSSSSIPSAGANSGAQKRRMSYSSNNAHSPLLNESPKLPFNSIYVHPKHNSINGSTYITLVSEPTQDMQFHDQQSQTQIQSQIQKQGQGQKLFDIDGSKQQAQNLDRSNANPQQQHTQHHVTNITGTTKGPNQIQGAKLKPTPTAQTPVTLESVPYIQLYCWLDILLVLSEDNRFVDQLQKCTVEFCDIYPYPIRKQSLVACIVTEIMRVFQLNLMLLKDSYIHKQTLGILINVLANSTDVSTITSQKLMKLFDMIQRRHSRLVHLKGISVDEMEEQSVYAKTLTALLALFVTMSNGNNPHFVYCILQAREMFAALHALASDDTGGDVQSFAKYEGDLSARIAYFHARVSSLTNPQTKDILSVIQSVIDSEKHLSTDLPVVQCNSQSMPSLELSKFMLPLVWELISTEVIQIDNKMALVEEFKLLTL